MGTQGFFLTVSSEPTTLRPLQTGQSALESQRPQNAVAAWPSAPAASEKITTESHRREVEGGPGRHQGTNDEGSSDRQGGGGAKQGERVKKIGKQQFVSKDVLNTTSSYIIIKGSNKQGERENKVDNKELPARYPHDAMGMLGTLRGSATSHRLEDNNQRIQHLGI